MSLAVKLGNMELEHPLMNAAGTCKSMEDVRKFARSATSASIVGSITFERRNGNEGQTYYKGQSGSLNSLGMPNPGYAYYREHLRTMAAITHDAGKLLIVSAAGFGMMEYVKLAYMAILRGADCVELNLGCPNVWKDGEQKRIASFDVDFIGKLLTKTKGYVGNHRIGVKLSPYSDPALLAEVASVIASHNVSYVATCNTFPNAILLDDKGKPVIDVGLAGMSGAAMKPIGLGQIKQLRQLLPAEVQLVGVGGIMHGRDVRDYTLVGADAVQLATAYFDANEDPNIFGKIVGEYADCA